MFRVNLRRWRVPVLLIAGAATLAVLWSGQRAPSGGGWSQAPPEVRALLWPEPQSLPAFRLTTQHGLDFGPESLHGQWGFVFFGYLHCPDVCPLTLHALREFRRALIERDRNAAGYRFVFVSIDPDRDSAQDMVSYLDYFDPAFIGLTGPPEALEPLTRALAVKVVAFENDGGVASIDHTSSVMVIDPQGRVVGALSPPHEPGRLLESFESLRRYLQP